MPSLHYRPGPDATLIGITGPRLSAAEITSTPAILLHAFSDAHYAYYPQAVARAGALPVHIPREAEAAALVRRIDALVVAGGQDVDPRRYGSHPTPASTRLDPARDSFELALIRAALEHDVPLVGVCRGMQLLNVALGGTLLDDLGAVQGIEHTLVVYPPHVPVHPVAFTPGSTLHAIYGPERDVNSFHHQGLGELGDGILAAGRAPDGIVEAVEVGGSRALGVQWHPEMLEGVDPLFAWLAEGAPIDQTPQTRLTRSMT